MPLLPPSSVTPLLRCPRCRGALAIRPDGTSCADPDCALSGRSFPEAGGQPVLVDFEASVLEEASLLARAGASELPRGTWRGIAGVARRLASPRNRVAARNAGALLARLREESPNEPRLLVIGGGSLGNGAEALYATPGIEVIGIDVYASTLTQFIADAHQIPLADDSVQAVWIQAVLEHVLEPARVVAEIERVLAPNGWVYAETPFLQHVHEGPWDFTRFTESGHRWLFRRFSRVDSGVVAGPATVWLWATEILVRGLTRSLWVGRLARLLLSWVSVFDRWIPRDHALDGASCFYFLGRLRGENPSPREAIAQYHEARRP